MARSPQGRSAAGDEAASTLSETSSVGSGSGGSSGALSKSGAGASPASASASTPSAEPATVSLPEVAYGKVLNVPDNLLGAGYTGKGWTIDEAVMEGGTPVIKLHRRVGNTGRIEEHRIDAETYARAKAYREKQVGMSKAFKPLALQKADLGRALDPQGEIIPDIYDAGSRSYRVRLPGAREPQWVSEEIIREFKQGREGSLQKLRTAAGLTEATSSVSTVGQAVTGAVAGAILGKNLATRFGLREANIEQAQDRPSTSGASSQSPSAQTREANRAANAQPQDRAEQEQQARQQRLRRLNRQRSKQGEEKETEALERSPDRGAAAYKATTTPDASSQVDIADSVSKSQPTSGTRLTIDDGTSPSAVEITNPSPSASLSQTIKRPLGAAIPQATPSQSVSEKDAGKDTAQQNITPGRVQASEPRSDARQQRPQASRESFTLKPTVPSRPIGIVETVETETETSIRHMRELMRAQAQERNVTSSRRLSVSVPDIQGTSPSPESISLPESSMTVSGGAAAAIGALAPVLAAAGGGAAQILASTRSKSLTMQAVRGAAQAVLNSEGMGREQALQRLQSTLQMVDGQIKTASEELLRPLDMSDTSMPDTVGGSLTTSQDRRVSAEGSASSRRIRVRASSTTPQDLSLLQRSAGTLRQAQERVSALPEGATVPLGFSQGVEDLSQLLSAIPSEVTPSDANAANEVSTRALQQFSASFNPAHEKTPTPPSSLQTTPSSLSSSASGVPVDTDVVQPIRVGAPPVPRRRRASTSPQSSTGAQVITGRSPLSPSLVSAVNLNAAQARDQGVRAGLGQPDARVDTLMQDSSIPQETPEELRGAPLSAGYASDTKSTEETEDILSTPAEEAQRMRDISNKSLATSQQFSGDSDPKTAPEYPETPSPQPSEPPASLPILSPQNQVAAAVRMSAAQEISRKKEEESGQAKSGSSPRPREMSFSERLTKGKLLMDLVSGCLDAVGFLEFLFDSGLGMLNDKYFKLHSLPSLTGIQGGSLKRTDRALRRGVFILDIFLAAVLLIGFCVIVTIVVAIVS